MKEFTLSITQTDIEQPDNIDTITKYIKNVAHAAYSKYSSNDITAIEFCIAKGSLIFGIKSRDTMIKYYMYNRLFYELERKFGLQFCPVYPEKETFYFLHDKYNKNNEKLKNALDIYPFGEGFDPNFSAFGITMFGRKYTVRLLGYEHLFETGMPHISAMKEKGITKFTKYTWESYNKAFEEVYNMKLIDAFERV